MKSYNGFEPEQRERALAWLKREYAAGRRTRPRICTPCGQTRGIIQHHSEDYSEPFGDHIGAFELCWLCHQMIHSRHRNPQGWDVYREVIRAGGQLPPASSFAQLNSLLYHPERIVRAWEQQRERGLVPQPPPSDPLWLPVLDRIHEGVWRNGRPELPDLSRRGLH